MASRGKLGGQHKIPRVIGDPAVLSSLLQMVELGMMRKVLISLFLLMASPVVAQTPPNILGTWMVADDGGVIALHACGRRDLRVGGRHHRVPAERDGAGGLAGALALPPADHRRPAAGRRAMWAGHITNPDDGKTYSIHVWLDEKGDLRMRGLYRHPAAWARRRCGRPIVVKVDAGLPSCPRVSWTSWWAPTAWRCGGPAWGGYDVRDRARRHGGRRRWGTIHLLVEGHVQPVTMIDTVGEPDGSEARAAKSG